MRVPAILLTLACAASPLAAQQWSFGTEGMPEILAEIESPTLRAALAEHGDRIQIMGTQLPNGYAGFTQADPSGTVIVFLDRRHDLTREEWQLVLIHELYAHAVPFLEDGTVCADPEDNRLEGSCVGEREAVILSELGRSVRRTYSLR